MSTELPKPTLKYLCENCRRPAPAPGACKHCGVGVVVPSKHVDDPPLALDQP